MPCRSRRRRPLALAPAAPAAAPAPAPPAAVPPAPPAPPELPPATAGTLREFFASKGVKMEPQKAPGFNALDLVLPIPQRVDPGSRPQRSGCVRETANRRSNSFYKSNAQLVVYRLVGDFDPHEAITHGYIDSQQQPAWRTTNASLADFNGAPSSIIEGTYRQDQMTVNTSRRHVIVTSGPDKYLVSLAVTTDASQAVAEAPSTDGIVNGFRAGPPGSTRTGSSPRPARARGSTGVVAPPQAPAVPGRRSVSCPLRQPDPPTPRRAAGPMGCMGVPMPIAGALRVRVAVLMAALGCRWRVPPRPTPQPWRCDR